MLYNFDICVILHLYQRGVEIDSSNRQLIRSMCLINPIYIDQTASDPDVCEKNIGYLLSSFLPSSPPSIPIKRQYIEFRCKRLRPSMIGPRYLQHSFPSSKYPKSITSAITFGIDIYTIGKWVLVAGCDGWDMTLITIDQHDYFQSSPLKLSLHCSPNLDSIL
jgi:hypothetical protein